MTFMAWPEIESFHHIRKFLRVDPTEWWQAREKFSGTSTVQYKCKVKLHGTNAAIQVHADGTLVPQSRVNIISVANDNAGFARWIESTKKDWTWGCMTDGVIIYGEWIGPGIQRNVAVSEIPKKCFAVFAARPLDGSDKLIVEPSLLEELVRGIPDTYVLPWYARSQADVSLSVDWRKSDEEITQVISPVNDWVLDIESNDPWVESIFGVNGTGEGLVFYPVSEPHLGWEHFQNLCFKAKGEKHKNIATAKPAQVSPESAASIEEFTRLVLTPARLEQGARAIMGEHKHTDALTCLFCTTAKLQFDLKYTGKFVQWIVGDVQKECQDELAASNLDWKQVQKPLSEQARAWYLTKAKQ